MFSNYNAFMSNAYNFGLQARKHENNMGITYATCFWQLDQRHSWKYKHREVRWNILTALIICNSEVAYRVAQINGEFEVALDFARKLISAWNEANIYDQDTSQASHRTYFVGAWLSGKYDLMTFTSAQCNKMAPLIHQLETHALTLHCPFETPFADLLDSPPMGCGPLYDKQAVGWMMKYLLFKEADFRVCEQAMYKECAAGESAGGLV